jgi:hypothetical protein
MTDYQPQLPRMAVAVVAAAMTAITLATLALAPAVFMNGAAPAVTRAQAAPTEVSIMPARIDVVGAREPDVAWALPGDQKPNCKPEV